MSKIPPAPRGPYLTEEEIKKLVNARWDNPRSDDAMETLADEASVEGLGELMEKQPAFSKYVERRLPHITPALSISTSVSFVAACTFEMFVFGKAVI